MLDALSRYRSNLKLSPSPRVGEATSLILNITGTKEILENMVYQLVKEICLLAAKQLQEIEPIKAAKLLQVSTHWFRYTGITHQLHSGVDLLHVNKNARHSKWKQRLFIYTLNMMISMMSCQNMTLISNQMKDSNKYLNLWNQQDD